MDVKDIRRANLKTMINRWWDGENQALAAAVGRDVSYLSRFLTTKSYGKTLSAKFCRELEAATIEEIGPDTIHEGWMDFLHAANSDICALPLVSWERASQMMRGEQRQSDLFEEEAIAVPADVVSPSRFVVQMKSQQMSGDDPLAIPRDSFFVVDTIGASESGQLAFVQLKSRETPLLRRLEIDEDRWYLLAVNPRYETISVSREDVVSSAIVVFTFKRLVSEQYLENTTHKDRLELNTEIDFELYTRVLKAVALNIGQRHVVVGPDQHMTLIESCYSAFVKQAAREVSDDRLDNFVESQTASITKIS